MLFAKLEEFSASMPWNLFSAPPPPPPPPCLWDSSGLGVRTLYLSHRSLRFFRFFSPPICLFSTSYWSLECYWPVFEFTASLLCQIQSNAGSTAEVFLIWLLYFFPPVLKFPFGAVLYLLFHCRDLLFFFFHLFQACL